jgi:hypothetical protein
MASDINKPAGMIHSQWTGEALSGETGVMLVL